MGAVELIIEAMRCHIKTPRVQLHACAVFQNLAYNTSGNQERIADAGGIEVIFDVMDALPNETEVQQYACGAFWNLCFNNSA